MATRHNHSDTKRSSDSQDHLVSITVSIRRQTQRNPFPCRNRSRYRHQCLVGKDHSTCFKTSFKTGRMKPFRQQQLQAREKSGRDSEDVRRGSTDSHLAKQSLPTGATPPTRRLIATLLDGQGFACNRQAQPPDFTAVRRPGHSPAQPPCGLVCQPQLAHVPHRPCCLRHGGAVHHIPAVEEQEDVGWPCLPSNELQQRVQLC